MKMYIEKMTHFILPSSDFGDLFEIFIQIETVPAFQFVDFSGQVEINCM